MPFSEIRKTKGGGDLGGENKRILVWIKESPGHIKVVARID